MNEYRATEDWEYHISAGGVILRRADNQDIEILILTRDASNPFNQGRPITYHLPKGTLHHNETLEDCALREVEEESGARSKIIGYLGAQTEDYFHPLKNFHIIKTIHYFVMEFVDFSRDHDAEHTGVEWLSIDDARAKLLETEPKKQEYLIVDRLKEFLTKFR
ncbi:NUDIX domain-containing protein [Candidatus Saccharibacteria bacterium]|nr:NUDIX domain-containing protein [Candidatus Saccharibacteria bacterium]MCL1962809.1 NUDIX domain-containing protein [Candidatus Saccharibacteria bacterium]